MLLIHLASYLFPKKSYLSLMGEHVTTKLALQLLYFIVFLINPKRRMIPLVEILKCLLKQKCRMSVSKLSRNLYSYTYIMPQILKPKWYWLLMMSCIDNTIYIYQFYFRLWCLPEPHNIKNTLYHQNIGVS